MRIPALLLAIGAILPSFAAAPSVKRAGVFYPPRLIERAKANARTAEWARQMRDHAVKDAAWWMSKSDTELWEMMFGPNITRSHMVWSAGFCPACKRPVPMYDWEIAPRERPWKTRCPHCREAFPKNDFEKFYRSGLDEHFVFDPRRADRKLLFNTEHPDAADPLHGFGVDDGEGYVEAKNRWRFIGAYLLYGQWEELVAGGIARLAAAYTLTGDPAYAHKAAVLLDRVADLFPTFDYAAQGLVYELPRYGGGFAGYVFYSIDSAYDVRRLTLAYDQIFDAIREDKQLAAFLAKQAARYHPANAKDGFAGIQHNIEERILQDALRNPDKIRTNYPGREGVQTMIRTVLGWPENRAEIMQALGEIVAQSTAVDGVSGEKGLTGYATIAPQFLGDILEQYARVDPRVLPELLERHPGFRNTYKFFAANWCARQYYPYTGDCGAFAIRTTEYAGLRMHPPEIGRRHDVSPPVSMFSYLDRLRRASGDPFYAQLMHLGNGGRSDNLPYDILAEDPAGVQREVEAAVRKHGAFPKFASVNHRDWRLAVLRSPRNPDAGAVWLDYDSIPNSKLKSHFHYDAMNLGLIAKGLDLLPEFGYPAVQFGSWHTPQALWHGKTAAHNTVVVDGKNQQGGDGRTTLWAEGESLRAIRASSPAQIRGKQYERTVAMLNTGGEDFYVFDVFRVAGGHDHAKIVRSSFSRLETGGLTLASAPDYGFDTLMRGFRGDRAARPGWTADFQIEDRYKYLPPGSDVHLRYTDLTSGAEAYTCESWTVKNASSTEEYWIPTVMTRRRGEGELASAFVGILEPYEKSSRIASIRRLPLTTPEGAPYGDAHVAVEVRLADGRTDVIAAADAENPLGLTPSIANGTAMLAAGTRFGAEFAVVRRDAAGRIERVALGRGRFLESGDVRVELRGAPEFVEIAIENGRPRLAAGSRQDIAQIRIAGKPARLK